MHCLSPKFRIFFFVLLHSVLGYKPAMHQNFTYCIFLISSEIPELHGCLTVFVSQSVTFTINEKGIRPMKISDLPKL